MFTTIRLLFWAAVVIIAFLAIRKSKVEKKRRLIIVTLACALLLGTVSQLLLIENVFVTFSSPESAFGYISSGEVRVIIEGKETTMILSSTQDAESYTILPKTDKGWKISTGIAQREVFGKTVGLCQISVHNYRNTSDYYISIVDVSETARENLLSISDSKGSSFHEFVKNPNSRSVTYMAYVDGFDESSMDEYYLLINGEKIVISN